MAWTDKMVEDLKQMWKDGLTTGEIGRRLGVSKNSIVGKVHRLGLSGRPSPIKKKGATPAKPAAPKPTSKPESKAEAKTIDKQVANQAESTEKKLAQPEKVSPEKKPLESEKKDFTENFNFNFSYKHEGSKEGFTRLVDLDNHTCRWPIGDPKDENFHFCGKKVKIGQTYCEEHAALDYVKSNLKK